MTRAFVLILAVSMSATLSVGAQTTPASCTGENVLTPAEAQAGWRLLFDGHSLAGWHGFNKQGIESWRVDGCALQTAGTAGNYGSDTRPDLVTDAEFTNFELALEWKATRGGNSGVMYGVIEDPKYERAVEDGPRVPAD